jgi:hypothetical protein
MQNTLRAASDDQIPATTTIRRGAWIGLLAGSSIGFSLIFACATPFVALATVATITMIRRDALIVTVAAWLANQAVGYGILNYPHTPESYAWGAATGVAALLALLMARTVCAQVARRGPVVATAMTFTAAFAVYELALHGAAFWLPSDQAAFSWSVVAYILQVNAAGLAVLLILRLAAMSVGLNGSPASASN